MEKEGKEREEGRWAVGLGRPSLRARLGRAKRAFTQESAGSKYDSFNKYTNIIACNKQH